MLSCPGLHLFFAPPPFGAPGRRRPGAAIRHEGGGQGRAGLLPGRAGVRPCQRPVCDGAPTPDQGWAGTPDLNALKALWVVWVPTPSSSVCRYFGSNSLFCGRRSLFLQTFHFPKRGLTTPPTSCVPTTAHQAFLYNPGLPQSAVCKQV